MKSPYEVGLEITLRRWAAWFRWRDYATAWRALDAEATEGHWRMINAAQSTRARHIWPSGRTWRPCDELS